jgi:hypothetical protein
MRSNAFLRVGAGFLFVALVACHDSPTEPASLDLKGTWTGQLSFGTSGVSESVPVVVGQAGPDPSLGGTSTINATWSSPTLGACTFSGSLSQSRLSGNVVVERPDSSFCSASQLRVDGQAATSRVSIDSREICNINLDLVPFHLVLSR